MEMTIKFGLIQVALVSFCGMALAQPVNPNKLSACPETIVLASSDEESTASWNNCWGTYQFEFKAMFRGDKVEGEWKNGKPHGYGTYSFSSGSRYVGEFKQGRFDGKGRIRYVNNEVYVGEFKQSQYHGYGIKTDSKGERYEGIFENGQFIRNEKVDLAALNNDPVISSRISQAPSDRKPASSELRLEAEKHQRELQRRTPRINLQVNNTQPTNDGSFIIDIQTNSDTSSLKINGNEEGGRQDGKYSIKLFARAGQKTNINIVATDIYGNSDTRTITVSREVVDSKVTVAALNPAQVKRQSNRDAVAIIIGISNYKTLPLAEFANDDARVFYDYAIRALGVRPENIKLLVDQDAEDVEIIKAFKTWLPSRVKPTTDVYVFYSGHGLPTQDGHGLYLLPPRADRDFVSRTSIHFQEINADIQATKPKSVTIFLDACYSGQSRSGETLIASARPVTLRSDKKLFPDNFTVMAASQADQISSSSADLKHGIFSYYLMKGMEGEADANKDGRITLGEMQAYLVENIGRQAGMVSRKQEPQLIGDANRVLVGR
jgi:hypothetical protein